MTDTLETVTCPACGKIMQKYFIQCGCAIDICVDGCGGIFFNNQEIQELNNSQSDLEEIKKLLQDKIHTTVDENQTRVCPACGTKMAKTRALGVQIDTCYNCNGIFLDNGELEQVRSHFKKRPKVVPINLEANNEVNVREFYKDAEYEMFVEKYGLEKRRKLSLLDVIFSFIV